MTRWSWALLLGGCAVVPAFVVARGPLPAVLYFGLCAAGLVVMASCARRLARGPRDERGAATGWWCTTAGFALWFVGDGVTAVQGTAADPSTPAAVPYLLGYLPLVAGLLLLAGRETAGRGRAAVLEGGVVSASLALLGLVWAVGPAFSAAGSEVDRLGQLVGVAYLAGDVALVALAVHVLAVSARRTTAQVVATCGFVLVLVCDASWLLVGASPPFQWVLGSGVLLCNHAWAAAAASARDAGRDGAPPAPRHHLSRRRLVLLAVAACLPTALLWTVVTRPGGGSGWLAGAVAVGGVLVCLLVVSRLAVALTALRTSTRDLQDAHRHLEHRATHDVLTGLADRARTRAHLAAALARGGPVGVLFCDLDGFKAVNDTHGHAAGDAVLRTTADRMLTCVREGDLVGRVGGDELVVVLTGVHDAADVLVTAERVLTALRRPLLAAGAEVAVSASIGAVLGSAEDVDGDAAAGVLLREADEAAYRAKSLGRDRAVLFDDALRSEAAERAAVEAELRTALDEDQLVLHFQPVVDLARDGRVDGVEALVRWQRPGGALVGPEAFVPVAERSDLVCELGRWVLREALRQQAAWARSAPGGRAPGVGVNIAPRHLAQPSFLDDVLAALAEHGTDPGSVVLEITETQVLNDPAALEALRRLREAGLRVAIDDFGTGYTSVGQLRHLPCDVLKIDRSLVVATDPGTAALLDLVVTAGHAFGMTVLAEGVETPAHEAAVRAAGADYAQGWLWSRAVPAAELDAVLGVPAVPAVPSPRCGPDLPVAASTG